MTLNQRLRGGEGGFFSLSVGPGQTPRSLGISNANVVDKRKSDIKRSLRLVGDGQPSRRHFVMCELRVPSLRGPAGSPETGMAGTHTLHFSSSSQFSHKPPLSGNFPSRRRARKAG